MTISPLSADFRSSTMHVAVADLLVDHRVAATRST
jgi:hypothetical protein